MPAVPLGPPLPLRVGWVVPVLPEPALVEPLDDEEDEEEEEEEEEDWLASSSASFASSAFTVDWSEETDSLIAVVSKVASVCPGVTCWPGLTLTDVTWPLTPKAAEALLTGSMLPTTVSVVAMSARVTATVRYPVLPPLTSAQAAAAPPTTSTATSPPTRTARR